MATLSNILRDLLVELGEFRENAATGGSSSTVLDGDLGGTDDNFNGGTVIITRDAGGSGGAPENEFGEVTDYTASSGTIASGTNFTQDPVSGDRYGVSTNKYPHFEMIRVINRALSQVGDIPLIDTSITTASSQTEYAIPVALKRQPPYQVDLQTITTDANNNQWREIDRGLWDYVPAVGGSTALLIIPGQLPIGRLLRIWYKGPHALVRLFGDTIYEGIHEEWLVWEAIYRALRVRAAKQDKLSDMDIQLLDEAGIERQKQMLKHTIWKPQRRSELLIVRRATDKDVFTVPGPA